jgi:multicomponent Na+:H+ antiporter subunit B
MQSLILRTATRFLAALMIVYSIFMLLRGHDEPGGGFIGALVACTAFALYSLAYGPAAVRKAMRADPRHLSMVGLGAGLVAGVMALLEGGNFLTGVWYIIPLEGGGYIPLSSVLLFDIGVYLVVIGAVLTLLLAVEEGSE